MSKARGTGASRSGSEPSKRRPSPARASPLAPNTPAVDSPNRPHDRYRALFENLFDGVFQSTPDGRLLTANPALVQMLGYNSEAELLAVDIASALYTDPRDRDRLVRHMDAEGQVRNQELVLRAKDGSRVVVLENSRAVRDEGDALLYYEGTLTNITAWREAEGLFRTLAEASPVGIFISQDMRFIFANATFIEMSGYAEEELMTTGPLQIIQESDRERVMRQAIDMLAGRTEDAFEHRLIRKGGETIWTLATVSAMSYRGRPALLGNFIDITERKQAQDLLQTVAASSPVAISIVQDERFQFVNPEVVRLTGRAESELLCLHPLDVVEPEDRELVWATAEARVKGDEPRPYEHRIINAQTGEVRWVLDTFTPIVYRGRPAVLGNSIDITERKLAEEQLAHQAFYDSLTGLPNRALFMQRLEHALAASKRRRKPVAVMFLDLDDFKIVNDSFGHGAGDALLTALGKRLQSCVRPTDTVARIGGDEFTVLLEATDWREDAIGVAERIVTEMKTPFEIEGNVAQVAASVGLAFSDPERHSAADLLREADVALYHAKSAGKGRYTVFGEERKAA